MNNKVAMQQQQSPQQESVTDNVPLGMMHNAPASPVVDLLN